MFKEVRCQTSSHILEHLRPPPPRIQGLNSITVSFTAYYWIYVYSAFIRNVCVVICCQSRVGHFCRAVEICYAYFNPNWDRFIGIYILPHSLRENLRGQCVSVDVITAANSPGNGRRQTRARAMSCRPRPHTHTPATLSGVREHFVDASTTHRTTHHISSD